MTKKEKYQELCKKEKTIPIFSKDWWLDAVCGEINWDVLLVEKGGQIVASLPYYLRKWGKGRYITQPPLTQTNGVWIKYPPNQKYYKKLAYEKKVMKEIINQLDDLNLDYYNQNFHYSITNWLPFYWKGFKQTTRYTYVIENLEKLEDIYKEFDPNLRNDIKKAKKNVIAKQDCDIEKFYKINTKTFERQNLDVSFSLEFLENLDKACKKNNCSKIFYAVDKFENIHAAIYLVWDKNTAYYLLGGGDPEYRNSQASSLLMLEAIKYSSKVTKMFNFEGTMIEPVEKFFRAFGAIQKPYFNISKNYKKNIFNIIARDIYDYYPILQKAYHKIKGK